MKNKLINIIIGIILGIIISLILTGCSSEANINKIQEFERIGNINNNMGIGIYYHKETKVMYLIGFKYGIETLVDSEGKPLLYEGE